jgi:hypothetical protein
MARRKEPPAPACSEAPLALLQREAVGTVRRQGPPAPVGLKGLPVMHRREGAVMAPRQGAPARACPKRAPALLAARSRARVLARRCTLGPLMARVANLAPPIMDYSVSRAPPTIVAGCSPALRAVV